MSDLLSIPAASLRTVWVFTIALDEEALPAFEEERPAAGTDERSHSHSHWPLRDALGLAQLDAGFAEVFMAEKLKDYGFARYLVEGDGMDEASVAPDADRLDALTGPVLVLHSGGLPEQTTRLDPRAPLTLVGRYTETMEFTLRSPLDSASAKTPTDIPPTAPRKKPSDAAMSGRVATVALLVMGLLVWLMIWMAG